MEHAPETAPDAAGLVAAIARNPPEILFARVSVLGGRMVHNSPPGAPLPRSRRGRRPAAPLRLGAWAAACGIAPVSWGRQGKKKKGSKGKKGKGKKGNKVAPAEVPPEFVPDEDVWLVHGLRQFFTFKGFVWGAGGGGKKKGGKGSKKKGKKKKVRSPLSAGRTGRLTAARRNEWAVP